MEILNKNQRETAVWRLVGFGFLVLLANAFIMFASFKAFKDKGAGDANSLRKELEECKNKIRGFEEKLNNEKVKYNTDTKKLKDQIKNQSNDKMMDVLKERNRQLETDLSICKQSQK